MVVVSRKDARSDARSDAPDLRVVTHQPGQWSSSVQSVLDQPPSNLPIRVVLGGVVFCGVFGAWAWWGQVDDVARAQGKLVPKGEVHKVNPVEAGKIARLAVKEGDTVQRNQIIAELDTELASKEVERLEKQLLSANLELTQTQGLLAQTQLQAQAKAEIAQTMIAAQEVTIAQTAGTVTNSQSVIEQLQVDAAAQEERLGRLRDLSEEGVISRDQVFSGEQSLRDRQRSITESQGSIERSLSEIERLKVGLDEKQAAAWQSQLEAEQQVQQLALKLTELQTKIKDNQVLLEAARLKRNQQFLRSPVSGTVLSLAMKQSGEVVQPGQTVAELAPDGQPLILSTVLPSREAGFVKVGMPVKVKFDAFPYQDFGVVPGKVITISPDSKPQEQGGQAYRVEVALERSSVKAHGQQITFKSGQTGTAEIVTRRRRILDVLLDPIRQLQGNVNL